MKNIFFLMAAFFCQLSIFAQLQSITTDLNVKTSFTLNNSTKAIGISRDSAGINKRENFLITEKAAKFYSDLRYLKSNDSLLFTGGSLSIGNLTTAGTNSLLFNNGRAEIQGSFNGMKFNIGSGYPGGGSYDASKSYLFQNRGNTYLSMSTTGGINTSAFYTDLVINGVVKITGGTPGINKILTSDASGGGTWQTNSAAPLSDPTFTGYPAAPTQPTGTNNTTLATTGFVANTLAAQVKDTSFITAASQNLLQVVTTAGKDSLGFKMQTANKFLASATTGTSDITARVIDITDISFAINTSTAQTIQGLKTVQAAATDGGQLGAELATTGTGTNWAGTSLITGYTHTAGSVAAFTSIFTPTTTNYYQIIVTATGTSGSITVSFGGYNSATLNFGATVTVAPQATTTGALIITPLTTFNGSVTVSIKLISTGTPSAIWANSAGTANIEIRANVLTNQFIGLGAGRNNTTGTNNTGEGYQTLYNNTSGAFNTAVGYAALTLNNIGGNNLALGTFALASNTTGNQNISNGDQSLLSNTTGSQNVGIGYKCMYNSTTGSNNVAIGGSAGRFIADGVTSLTLVNNSTFIGNGARALADNQANQLVIGYNAIGLGNNTTVIGNSTTTALGTWGNLTLQGTTDKIILPATMTTAGTTGAQTINKASGSVNIAIAGISVVVTNSLITATSLVRAWVRTADINKTYVYAIVPVAGSFTIYVTPAPAAEISVGFETIN